MTEPVLPPERERDVAYEEPAAMPRWVPVAIGIVLVTLAALAVITGLRYRDQTLVNIVQPRQHTVRPNAPAPPGEPEPGASLIFPGDAANVPPAREPVRPNGAAGVVHMSARRGLRTNVTPSDAIVYINDIAIGQASQFNSDTEEYDFAAPGSYVVRLVAPGYKERMYVVNVDEYQKQEVARIDVKLEK